MFRDGDGGPGVQGWGGGWRGSASSEGLSACCWGLEAVLRPASCLGRGVSKEKFWLCLDPQLIENLLRGITSFPGVPAWPR